MFSFELFSAAEKNVEDGLEEVVIDIQQKPRKKFKKQERPKVESSDDEKQNESVGFSLEQDSQTMRGLNHAALYRTYISFLHEYPEEYRQLIFKIFEGAKAKRREAQRISKSYGTVEVDPIQGVVESIQDHFQAEALNVQNEIPGGDFRMKLPGRKNKQKKTEISESAAVLTQTTKEVIQKEVAKEQSDSFTSEDMQAIEDTASIVGEFLATQAASGMKPTPNDLAGFLSSINFIALAPAVVHCCADICNCSPKVEKRFVIAATITAVIVTLGLQAFNVAVSWGALN